MKQVYYQIIGIRASTSTWRFGTLNLKYQRGSFGTTFIAEEEIPLLYSSKQVMVLLLSEVIHPSKYASQLFWSQKLNRIFINRRKSVVLPLTVDSEHIQT